MSWDAKWHDRLQPKSALPYLGDAAASFSVATTEYVVFDTTRIAFGNQSLEMESALAAGVRYRQSCPHVKRAFLSVVFNQDMQFFHRVLPITARASNLVDATDWDAVFDNAATPASPTELLANTQYLFTLPFFGDDHQLVLKTKATPPTRAHVSLRFTSDQALAE